MFILYEQVRKLSLFLYLKPQNTSKLLLESVVCTGLREEMSDLCLHLPPGPCYRGTDWAMDTILFWLCHKKPRERPERAFKGGNSKPAIPTILYLMKDKQGLTHKYQVLLGLFCPNYHMGT